MLKFDTNAHANVNIDDECEPTLTEACGIDERFSTSAEAT